MTTNPIAERLYYDACDLGFGAHVTDIRLNSQTVAESGKKEHLWQVALDRTAFYPGGGGQPCDTGMLIATARSGAVLEAAVERVEEDESGEIWHFLRKPLPQGTELVGRVDPDRRMDHAQQHTGQHLLSAVFFTELGARTTSFHLSPLRIGTETVTIDLALKSTHDRLTDVELRRVESATNRLIYEDRAVHTKWLPQEQAREMLQRGDLQKLPERTGLMRIVEIGGVEFNACGGTHVSSTGAIGGVLVRRVEKAKQGWRVEFCCGLRAVRTAREDFLRISELARVLSVGAQDVLARVEGLIEKNKTAAKEHKALLRELSQAKAAKLVL